MKNRIKQIIVEEKLTYSDFAKELDITKSSVTHIVNGRNNPSLDVILKILTIYKDVNPEWLLFGSGEMYRKDNNENLIFNTEKIIDDTIVTPKDDVIPSKNKTEDIDKRKITEELVDDVDEEEVYKPKKSKKKKKKNKSKKSKKKNQGINESSQKSNITLSEKVIVLNKDKTYTEYIPLL